MTKYVLYPELMYIIHVRTVLELYCIINIVM